ncbi:ComEC/Rec2 family competence protein [Patescibacteria group bacterium]|nr:ComEC/Rec2 family competence protein [Patescibacteria group bacterium]
MSASVLANLCLVFFLIGVGVASVRPVQAPTFVIYALIALLLVGVWLVRSKRAVSVQVLLLGFLIGWCLTGLWRVHHFSTYRYGSAYRFTGVITEPADIRATSQLLSVLPDQAIAEGLDSKLRRTLIRIRAPRYPTYQYGDRLSVAGVIDRPEPFSGFNYPLYLERYQIYGEITRSPHIEKIGSGYGNRFSAWLYGIRQSTEDRIAHTLSEPEASFLAGILLGSKRSIPADIQADLQTTGTVHIVVISGSNITILLEILLYFLPVYKRKSQLLAVIILGFLVSAISGASASVLRGATVAVLSRYLKLRSRFPWPTPFLLVSVTFLCLYNPLLLAADPGFQISFAAFAGLAYLATPLADRIRRSAWLGRIPEPMQESIAQTLAASCGISALSFKEFGQLSLLGLVVNPIVLWLLYPITTVGLILAFFGWIPPVAAMVKLPLWLSLHLTLRTVSTFARWPVGVIHANISWLGLGLFYALLIPIIYLLFHRKLRHVSALTQKT